MELQVIDNKPMLNSVDVAEMVEKEHKNLLRDIRGYIEAISTSPKLSPLNFFVESSYKDSKNETRPMYLLSKLGCEMVANKMIGKKGILFTALYVQKFNEMESQKKLPTTYKEALLALIEAEEEKERMLPKANYFDKLVERNLLTNFRDTAKELKVGERKFIQWLLDENYIYRDKKGKLKPHSQHMDLFELKEWVGNFKAGNQTLITPKGRETFRLLLDKEDL